MTHSTAFPLDAELEAAFGRARTEGSKVRGIEIFVTEERFTKGRELSETGSLEDDWASMLDMFEEKKPAYVVFRLDSKNDTGYEWMLVSYVPDGCPVKARMLYASSRDTLKKQLSRSVVSKELHGSSRSDLDWAAFQAAGDRSAASEVVMSSTERAMAAEASMEVATGPSGEYVHGVRFPLSEAARQALEQYVDKALNFVQLGLDMSGETVELIATKQAVFAKELPTEVPDDAPRFSLFRFEHEHKGESFAPDVFIYSCPASAKIKEKMTYSSVKAVAIDACTALGASIAAKVEVDESADLTPEFLHSYVHEEPREIITKPKFERPKPARGRSTPSSRGRPQRTKK